MRARAFIPSVDLLAERPELALAAHLHLQLGLLPPL